MVAQMCLMEDALRHGQGPLTDVDRQEQLTLRLQGAPDPVRGARQALDRLGLGDLAILERAEDGIEFVQLHLANLEIAQEIGRKRLELVPGLHQPVQDGVRVDLLWGSAVAELKGPVGGVHGRAHRHHNGAFG